MVCKKLSWLDSFSEDERYAFYSWQRSGADLRRQQSGEKHQNKTQPQHKFFLIGKASWKEGIVMKGLCIAG